MDKFFFAPSRQEMAAALRPMFAPHLSPAQVDSLLESFPGQAMDFFGSIMSRLADAAVRDWQQGQSHGAVRNARTRRT